MNNQDSGSYILVNMGHSAEYNQAGGEIPWSSLGLAYLASALANANFKVEIIDSVVDKIPDDKVVEIIIQKNPRYVGFSPFFFTRNRVKATAKKIKEHLPNVHIGLGGHDSTYHILEDSGFYDFADSIVRGEGEQVIIEIAQRLERRQSLEGIVGVAYRTNRKLQIPDDTNVICDLDSIAFPLRREGEITVGMFTSRGCLPKKVGCRFCTTPQFYPKGFRKRSLENVFEELEDLVERGAKNIAIYDDQFFGFSKKDIIERNEIIKKAKEYGVRLTYVFARVDNVHKAHRSGLFPDWKNVIDRVFLGVESFSTEELGALGKFRNDPQESKEAVRLLKDNDIGVQLGLIPFNAFTQLKSLRNYSEWLAATDEAAYFINFSHHVRAYPGTRLREDYRNAGLLLEDSEDLYAFNYHFSDPRVERLAHSLSEVAKEVSDRDIFSTEGYFFLTNKDLGKCVVIYDDREIPQDGYPREVVRFGQAYKSFRRRISQLNQDFFNTSVTLAENGWDEHEFRERKEKFLEQGFRELETVKSLAPYESSIGRK